MRTIWGFYWRWLKTAFRHSYSHADSIAGFIGLLVQPVAKLALGREVEMNGEIAIQIMGYAALAVIAVRVVAAPFWIHSEDMTAVQEIERDREKWKSEADMQNPELSGSIDAVITSGSGANNLFLINARIRNTGAPSALEQWNVFVCFHDGTKLSGRIPFINEAQCFAGSRPSSIALPGIPDPSKSEPVVKLTAADQIQLKGLNPIPTGGIILGFIAGEFPLKFNGTEVLGSIAKFGIEFCDVTGKRHELVLDATEDSRPLGHDDTHAAM